MKIVIQFEKQSFVIHNAENRKNSFGGIINTI